MDFALVPCSVKVLFKYMPSFPYKVPLEGFSGTRTAVSELQRTIIQG